MARKQLGPNATDPQHYTDKEYVDGVLKYATVAEVDAALDGDFGYIQLLNTQDLFGTAVPAGIGSDIFIRTFKTNGGYSGAFPPAGSYEGGLAQEATFMRDLTTIQRYIRNRYYDGTAWLAWGPWSQIAEAKPSLATTNFSAVFTPSVDYDQNNTIVQNVAGSVKIPLHSAQPFPTGTVIRVVRGTTAAVSITTDVGVTLRNPYPVTTLRAQYSAALVQKIGTNTWVLMGDIGDDAPTNLKKYASTADLDAVATSQIGVVKPATNWGAYTGDTALNDYPGEALVETIAGQRISGGITTDNYTQYLSVGKSNSGYDIRLMRVKFGGSAWTAWETATKVPAPTNSQDAATKLYVDAKSLTNISWADLDTLPGNNSRVGLVSSGSNLGTATGIAKYNGWGGGELWYESYGVYATADWFSAQVQRVHIPNLDGTVDIITRHRDDDPGWSMGAWSAWTIYTPPQPVLPGIFNDREQTHGQYEVRAGLNTSAGNLFVTYARARFTGSRSNVAFYVSTEGTGVTDSFIGVYSVNQSTFDLISLVAQVSDSTIPAAIGRVQRTLSAPVSFVEGQWYAVAHLNVGGTPGARAAMGLPSFAVAPFFDPPTHGYLTGQTALPTGPVTKATIVNSTSSTLGAIYYEFT